MIVVLLLVVPTYNKPVENETEMFLPSHSSKQAIAMELIQTNDSMVFPTVDVTRQNKLRTSHSINSSEDSKTNQAGPAKRKNSRIYIQPSYKPPNARNSVRSSTPSYQVRSVNNCRNVFFRSACFMGNIKSRETRDKNTQYATE
ncbi:hypothetical protein RF11_14291 [Thelohanellus kitauei]|uniref:Uncharacterized protein n=1 Tax=Thelohanellus kitauei TaxID=669202 RepID=A0A0C2MTQ3_THEKT|nr:hypothetical protein RF11_14291 [Thelohanellus kitauei]